MLELPEVLAIAGQLKNELAGRRVRRVLPPSKIHKFCWYNGDPAAYDAAVRGSRVLSAEGFGIFVEIVFDNGCRLCFNDGVNIRLLPSGEPTPKGFQLLLEFEDDSACVFTVAMYGGIILHDGGYDNEYYIKSRQAVSPFSDRFKTYFDQTLAGGKPSLSVKAFLAAEQRFPGVGNGVLQDILLASGIHPKRKLGTLDGVEKEKLFGSMVAVLGEMTGSGGRDTERDIFGRPGGYRTRLSRNTLAGGCPLCGGPIVKEAYLGGTVYYCPACQPPVPKDRAAGV